MANGIDDLPDVRVLRSADEFERAAGQAGRNSLLTFMPPVPDSADQFRTEESEEISQLVRDLASARVDAAREAENIREQATRRAQANLLSTLGAQGLTQAITGLDVGAPERAQQAQETLRQAQEAEAEAETQAEQTAATAPVQADIRSKQVIQQDKQQAQETLEQRRQQQQQALQNSLDRIDQARRNAVDRQSRRNLAEQRHQNKMEQLRFQANKRMDRLMRELGVENAQEVTGQQQEQVNKVLNFASAVDLAKSEVDQILEEFDPERGTLGSTQDVQRRMRAVSNTLSDLKVGRGDTPGVLPTFSELPASIKEQLPADFQQKFNRLRTIMNTFAGSEKNTTPSGYARNLRGVFGEGEEAAKAVEEFRQWNPDVQVLGSEAFREASGIGTGQQSEGQQGASGTSDTGDQVGQNNIQNLNDLVEGRQPQLDQGSQQKVRGGQQNGEGRSVETDRSEPTVDGAGRAGGGSTAVSTGGSGSNTLLDRARSLQESGDLSSEGETLLEEIETLEDAPENDVINRSLQEKRDSLRSIVEEQETTGGLAEQAERTEARASRDRQEIIDQNIREQEQIAQNAEDTLERAGDVLSEERRRQLERKAERARRRIENIRENPEEFIPELPVE